MLLRIPSMAFGVVKSLVVSRASSLLRVSGAQARINSASNISTYVVGSGGAMRASKLFADCLENQWSFRARLSAAQKATNVRDRGFAHGKTRRGWGADRETPRLASAAASKGDAAEAVENDEKLEDGEWRSRNQNKRDAKRARQWGIELATFAPAQVKQAVRWAGLPEDVYDAVMIVKNLGTSSRVRNGRRRQYNYIGGLLREVDPNIMEPVLKATKDGDVEDIILNSPVLPDPADEDDKESWADEEDEEDSFSLVAEEWLNGLVGGISAIEEEVYSIYDVDYDRQELRKLVLGARRSSVAESSATSEPSDADGVDSAVLSAIESKSHENLRQFLIHIARQRVENNAALL